MPNIADEHLEHRYNDVSGIKFNSYSNCFVNIAFE